MTITTRSTPGDVAFPRGMNAVTAAGVVVEVQCDAAGAVVLAPLAHERDIGTANAHGESTEGWNYTLATADADISSAAPAKIRSVTVTVATALAAIDIRDATVAGAGNILLTIPLGTAANTRFELDGVKCLNGIYADYAATATGTIRVAWRPTGANS